MVNVRRAVAMKGDEGNSSRVNKKHGHDIFFPLFGKKRHRFERYESALYNNIVAYEGVPV